MERKTNPVRRLALLGASVAVMWMTGCGGVGVSDEDFLATTNLAAPRSLPANLLMNDLGTELVTNGSFEQGDAGWLQSTRRKDFGVTGSIIGAIPAEIPLPGAGSANAARMCGHSTSVTVGDTTTRGNCVDILKTKGDALIVVPRGTKTLTISTIAFANYGCQGELPAGHGALAVALRAVDGLPPLSRSSGIQAKEADLPAGQQRRLVLDITDIPGVDAQERRFELLGNFQTGTSCRSPEDLKTYVILTNISIKAKN